MRFVRRKKPDKMCKQTTLKVNAREFAIRGKTILVSAWYRVVLLSPRDNFLSAFT